MLNIKHEDKTRNKTELHKRMILKKRKKKLLFMKAKTKIQL
jgi:hypothetical protein